MNRLSAAAALSVALMLLAGIAMAKGGLGQITVTGPGLEHPIEIDDPQILDEFNPWGGLHRFLTDRLQDDLVDTAALKGPYEVRFFESVHEWVYEFSYYTDEDGAVGYILLPQPPVSQGFVHPAGWYRSSDAWSDVMSDQLELVATPTTPPGSWVAESLPQLLVLLLAFTLLGLAVFLRRQGRERKQRHLPGKRGTSMKPTNRRQARSSR